MANFTPNLKPYSGQGKFRYWVQMVLPTIYDDSLSYMELLNKVVYVINLAIEDIDTVEENVAALLTAFEELQQFTNDYFDNLDVQEEINNKLDEMVDDGTLSTLLAPLLQGYQTQLDILEERVDNLSQTITPGSTSGDAEIIDVRVGYDGNTYPNAGDSVRTQVGGLADVIFSPQEYFWRYGGFNASSNPVNSNAVSTGILRDVNTIVLSETAQASVLVYKGTEYLGKINSSGNLDKTSGNWKIFTGIINVGAIFDKYNADGVRIGISPTDSIVITSETAQEYGETHCTLYASNYSSKTEVNSIWNRLAEEKDIIWTRGGINATGDVVNVNGIISPIMGNEVMIIKLANTCYCGIGLYRDGEYIGKINYNENIDQVYHWEFFYNIIKVQEIYDRYNANGLRIGILPLDDYEITPQTAQEYGNEHCEIFIPEYTVDNTTVDLNDIKWIYGGVTATGNDTIGNAVTTIILHDITTIDIKENSKAAILLFNGDEYLGKINSSGEIDKVSGNWKYYTGKVDISSLFTIFNADGVRISVTPTNGDIITIETAEEYGNAHCTFTGLKYVTEKWLENDVYNLNKSPIPDYYATQMKNKVALINENINSVGKFGETFVFITDIHWDANHKESPKLVKHILDNTNTKILLCGGDLINKEEKPIAEAYIMDCLKQFDYPGYFMPVAFGNHDDNGLGWATEEEKELNQFSQNEIFGLIQKNSSNNVNYVTDNTINFYFDRDDSKTRFIVLDSGIRGIITNESFTGFLNMLQNTPNNYHIVLLIHWIWYNNFTASFNTVQQIVKAFNDKTSYTYDGATYDFSNNTTEINLIIAGHNHGDHVFDINDPSNTSGVPIVISNGDTYRDNPTAIRYTDNSQCFNVITLDYTERKAHFVRIGRGDNFTVDF